MIFSRLGLVGFAIGSQTFDNVFYDHYREDFTSGDSSGNFILQYRCYLLCRSWISLSQVVALAAFLTTVWEFQILTMAPAVGKAMLVL